VKEDVAVERSAGIKYSLSDDEVLTLARWAVAIEAAVPSDTPIDIEWAKNGIDWCRNAHCWWLRDHFYP